MAKNSVDAYGAQGKTNTLMFDPDNLVLVEDKSSPLYDERVHDPIDEAMVASIIYHGIIEPVVVAKNPETDKTEVVAGRQRVKNAREANRRLREQGREPRLVPAVVRQVKGSERYRLTEVGIAENERRREDTPLGRAAKMALLKSYGRTNAQIAEAFGCVVPTVVSTLALLETTADVQEAVEKGQIGIGQAVKLSKLPAAEQRAKTGSLLKAAKENTGHAKTAAQRAILSNKPRLRSIGEIRSMVLDLEKSPNVEGNAIVIKWLKWVLGEA